MLLNDLVSLATDDKQPITTLLRKCIVLAYQLKNDRLKIWANEELNGYTSIDNLPEYRTISAAATGLFVGPGWARLEQGIPSAALKEKHRRYAEVVYIAQPVSTLEDTAKSTSGSSLSFPWNANLVAHYRESLIIGWQLHSAQQTVTKSVIAGILDTVRTRVLNMTLEIQSELGETDENLKEITPEESKKVDQTIVANIYGGNVYVSAGQSTMTATTVQQQNIVAGDWEHLAKVLKGSGVSEAELTQLSAAVETDGQTMGSKVKGWIQKAAPKVLSGGVKIGAEVGQKLLLEYLKQYLGLPS
jgi:AbiTii